MGTKALGRLYDIAPVISPVDLAAAAATGNLVSLANAHGVEFVVVLDAAASGTEDVVITVREAQDGAGTGEQDLDVVTEYHRKSEATLDNDEQWTTVTQTAGDITHAGASFATQEGVLSFYIDADDLSDGFTHVTVDIADVGTVARFGTVLALPCIKVGRAPANLAAPQ